MISASISPTPIALAGNPVVLSIYSTSVATFRIDNIYTGSVEAGTTDIHIDEILQELLPEWSFNHISADRQNDRLIPAAIYRDYTITVTNAQGNRVILSHTILPGGVSKDTLRALVSANNNIFNFKLLNPANNIFMTSRTNGQFIVVRETEIMPLVFLYPGGNMRVVSGDVSLDIPAGTERRPYALNIPAIRKELFAEYNCLSNRFDIYFNQSYSATVLLTPGAITDARYIIEFLNSYGVYERVEVSGSVNLEPEADEESIYSVYDPVVNDYVEKRDRRPSRNILQVESGFKTQEELIFLIDMLASEKIFLLGYGEQPIECTASAEDMSVALISREPASLHITLRFVDKDTHFTHSVPLDFDGNRIHVDQFSQQFN